MPKVFSEMSFVSGGGIPRYCASVSSSISGSSSSGGSRSIVGFARARPTGGVEVIYPSICTSAS